MSTKKLLCGAASLGSVLAIAAVGLAKEIELSALAPMSDYTVPTKMVRPLLPPDHGDVVVKLAFVLDPTGRPRKISLLESNDPNLNWRVINAVSLWRFTPIVRNGVPENHKVVLPLIIRAESLAVEQPALQVGAVSSATATETPIAGKQGKAYEHPAVVHATTIERNGVAVLRDGATPSEVIEALGAPGKMINQDLWVYPGFSARTQDADNHGCSTLLVRFQDHRVSSLALANGPAMELVSRQTEVNPGYLDRIVMGMHQFATLARK